MTLLQAAALFLAALIAGGLNSVAGGGSFVTFPTLVVVGNVPPVPANATSTVALWPGAIASVWAYRRQLKDQQPRRLLWILIIVSLVGGTLGAIILLNTPSSVFEVLVPYFLLLATVLFAFSSRIVKWLRQRNSGKPPADAQHISPTFVITHFAVSIYGGYFGSGVGIIMLAVFAIAGMTNINSMNGLKTLLNSCMNSTALLTFVLAGVVSWPQALVMIFGALIGGYGGAYVAQLVDPKWVRRFVVVVSVSMTIYFFIRAYF